MHSESVAETAITVIYDGQCRICRASINWLQIQSNVNALSFYEIDPKSCNLTLEECQKQVIAIQGEQIFKGAAAVAFLLDYRGNTATARFIRATGPLGRFGYRWVSTHRNSAPVKVLTQILEKLRKTRSQ
jgi:predicted DCC family thiol-disulfide oxidoreductase YuxK